jgi:hypothetical protein
LPARTRAPSRLWRQSDDRARKDGVLEFPRLYDGILALKEDILAMREETLAMRDSIRDLREVAEAHLRVVESHQFVGVSHEKRFDRLDVVVEWLAQKERAREEHPE